MFSRPIIAVAGGCAAVALLASGCGDAGDSTSVTTTRGTSAAGGSHRPTAAAAPNAAGPAACATATLKARLTIGGVAAGNRFATLVLTNTGPAACHTFGYPGLKLTGGGDPPTHAKRGYESDEGAPKRVTLKPGGSAWSRLQWGAVAGTGDRQSGDCQPTAKQLRVTPPDQRAYLTVPWSYGPVCERGTIQVNPLRPGDHDPRSAH